MLITFNSHSPTHTTSFKIFSLLRNEFFLLGPVMKINSLNIAYTVVKMVRKKKSLLLKVQKCSHVLSQAKNLTVFPAFVSTCKYFKGNHSDSVCLTG